TVSLIINPNNLNNYYQKADIYFSTSLYEGLSNSIIEAMEFSLPIVATNVGDNEYLIIEGQSGFLLPIKDAEGMSSKLKLLVDNPKQRVEFGHNAYRHLKNNFLEEIFKQKYINFINNLFDEC
ncbi:MAG TPA: glycosyltransferase, partial [Bacteroidales bacterium]|nr:glycosyltransferase [Bacteroidales bacterium]